MKENLALLAGILYIISGIPYINGIIKRQFKPVILTWLIWTGLDIVTLTGMFFSQTYTIVSVVAVLVSATIAVLSLFYGDKGWDLFDKLSLCGGVIGIILSIVSTTVLWAIIFSQLAIIIASIPIFKANWYSPEDNRIAWLINLSSSVCLCLSLEKWSLYSAAQPLNFLLINSFMCFLLFIHRGNKRIDVS